MHNVFMMKTSILASDASPSLNTLANRLAFAEEMGTDQVAIVLARVAFRKAFEAAETDLSDGD